MSTVIPSRFKSPSPEERAVHEMVTVTGLNQEIARIVFHYLFVVDKPFGKSFPALMLRSEKSFDHASKKIHSSKVTCKNQSNLCYPCEGDKEYMLPGEVKKASSLILEHMSLQDAESPYLHLDIGGGSGEFASALESAGTTMGRTVEGHTVSASDLRAKNSQVPDVRYHVCNASHILSYTPIALRSWNSITCVTTIFYLEDNARNLADFYALLAPGGLLVVQSAQLLGIDEGPAEMIDFLNGTGYAVIAFYTEEDIHEQQIDTLILQKTHPQLNFPITYDWDKPYIVDEDEDHHTLCALYSLDPRFLTLGNSENRQERIAHKLNGVQDGYNLLEEPESVSPEEQHPLTKLYQRALKREQLNN